MKACAEYRAPCIIVLLEVFLAWMVEDLFRYERKVELNQQTKPSVATDTIEAQYTKAHPDKAPDLLEAATKTKSPKTRCA